MAEPQGNYRDWWRPPRKYGVDSSSRSVSFLELFYDLVYVVVIAELSHTLATHLNMTGIIEFVVLFFLVWWGWFNGTLYHDLHGNQDIRTRFFTFLQMGLIISLAVFAHNAFSTGMTGFFVTFGIFTLVFAYLWWRVGVHDPLHTPASVPYAISYTIFGVVFIIAGFLANQIGIYLVAVNAILIFLFPIVTSSRTEQVRTSNDSRPNISPAAVERFGLFNIIVLGEVIVGVVQGMAEFEELTVAVATIAGLGLLVAFSTWWIYFDLVSHHPPKDSLRSTYTWLYFHMPLSLSIAAIGAVILNVVQESTTQLSQSVTQIFIGSIVLMLATIIIISQSIQVPEVHEQMYSRIRVSILLSIIAILSLLFVNLEAVPFMVLIVVFMLIPIVYGVRFWIHMIRVSPEFRETRTEL